MFLLENILSVLTVWTAVLGFVVQLSGAEHCVAIGNRLNCFFVPSGGNKGASADGDYWERAWKLCSDKRASLPVVDNRAIQAAIENYMKHHHPGEEVWAAGRGTRSYNWFWINGRQLNDTGLIDNHQYLSQVFDTQAIITYDLKMSARYPGDKYNSLCFFTGSVCQSEAAFAVADGCVKQVTNASLRWYEARNECLDAGGDLPTFEDQEDVKAVDQYFNEMASASGIWIGLRKQWWNWKKLDSMEEVKYSSWLDHDNYINRDCMILTENGNKWKQQICYSKKKFFCHSVRSTESVASAMSSNDKPPEPINPMSVTVGITIPVIIIVAVASVVVARKWRSCFRKSDSTSPRSSHDLEARQRLQTPPSNGKQQLRQQEVKLKPNKQEVELLSRENPNHDAVWVSRT